jgi:endonuclease/exonuclease/phosphatase family metal-dependent hydrolase
MLCLVACSPQYPNEPDSLSSNRFYTIGTWNIEYLHDSHSRGFPEFLFGGPVYQPRGDSDYAALARVIGSELDAVILVLNEIHGVTGVTRPVSIELDRLRVFLGAQYAYVLSQSGGNLRTAILYDRTRARLDTSMELTYPEIRVEGADLFERDPLVAKFTLLLGGEPQHDLVVVALHLASGKANAHNHDSALALLVDTLDHMVTEAQGVFRGEVDLLLAGDLNLDYFDAHRESLLESMERGSWSVLAGRGYPYTRLGGVPLLPESRLDYLICTDAMRGLRGLIGNQEATVHDYLARRNYDSFRQTYSDHYPVTITLRVSPDDD